MTKTSEDAEVVREYGPFQGVERVHGVTHDGQLVWFATGSTVQAFEPGSGDVVRTLELPAHAGTAYDGKHLYQIAEDRIHKIDRESGRVLSSIPAPGGGSAAGLTWAEGMLWVAQYRDRKIHQVDPESGTILRTIESNRFVTGVTWTEGELWHGTYEDEASELRRVEPTTGEVLTCLKLPEGASVTGLEADGEGLFYCGGGRSGTVRAVRRPRGVTKPR